MLQPYLDTNKPNMLQFYLKSRHKHAKYVTALAQSQHKRTKYVTAFSQIQTNVLYPQLNFNTKQAKYITALSQSQHKQAKYVTALTQIQTQTGQVCYSLGSVTYRPSILKPQHNQNTNMLSKLKPQHNQAKLAKYVRSIKTQTD